MIVEKCLQKINVRCNDRPNIKCHSWSRHFTSRSSKGMEFILQLAKFCILESYVRDRQTQRRKRIQAKRYSGHYTDLANTSGGLG
jgi:hypothetical protein